MSIVASTLVHDGLVMGTDSMVQITGLDSEKGIAVIQSYQHAQKLYRFSSMIGVATWGIGNVGPRSVGSFIAGYARSSSEEEHTVESVAQGLIRTFQDVYKEEFKGFEQEKLPRLGALVGGYSPDDPLAEEWEFVIPHDTTPRRVREPKAFGASWRGIVGPFTRVYRGIDPHIRQHFLKKGITEEELDQLTAPFVFDGMPIQEAIDFVVFILQTTINVAKFEAGASSCGGPLWVALITRDKFQWVQSPKWRIRGLPEDE